VCRDLINSISFLSEVKVNSRVVVYGDVLTCDHIPTAVVQGIRRGRGNCRYCLTLSGDSISKVCRDLINSISFLSEVNVKSRVVVYGVAI